MTDNETQDNSTRPVVSFSGSGGIHVAVWKNKSETDQEFYSIKIERRYKDEKDGEYKSTPYLRGGDLLRAQRLLGDADAWIEQDRQKNRLANQNAAAR